MKSTNLQHITISLLSGLALISISLNTAVKPAQAGLFDDIRIIVGDATKTVETIKDIHASVTHLSKLLGLSNTKSTDLLDIYSDWFKSMSTSEKDTIKIFLNEYAEDKQLSFSTFKSSPEYAALSPQAKSAATAIFFKFKEVTNAAVPVKDRFLAFAFCLSGGSTKCK